METCLNGCVVARLAAKGLCRRCYNAEWRARNPEKIAAYAEGCKRRWIKENKERLAAYMVEYRAANLERRRELSRSWYWENKAYVSEYDAARHQANPQKKRDATRKWKAANPGKDKEYKQARRNRKRGVDPAGFLAAVDSGMTERPCACCGREGPSRIDHIIPLAWVDGCPAVAEVLGFEWAYQPLCDSCNAAKRDRHISAYIPTGDIGADETEAAEAA